MDENQNYYNKALSQEELIKKENIKRIFFELFCEKGFSSSSSFDFGVWFMKRHHMKENFQKDFENILMKTPTEDDDIIQSTLIKAYLRSRNMNFSIKILDFVDELAQILMNLKNDSSRVEKLIKTYNAYETKNSIELNINNYEKFMKLNYDLIKSNLICKLEGIENLPRGDYRFFLIVGFYNESKMRETKLEYRLNNLVKINDEEKNNYKDDYYFQNIEFYSYESSNMNEELKKYESGTNILYFQIKIENLWKNYNEFCYSEKKTILDIFLSNIDSIVDSVKSVKKFFTEFLINDTIVKFRMDIEFDPFTLSSIYNKIKNLLQDIISFKVLVDHKYRTIMDYFPEISNGIEETFSPKPEESNCIIY